MPIASLCVPWILVAAAALPRGEHVRVFEGDVDAPVTAVWRALATEEGLVARGCKTASVELKVGGRIRAARELDGALEEATQTILAFEPERLLATRFDDGERAWSVTYLSASSPTRTHLRVTVIEPGERGPDVDDGTLFASACEAERLSLESAAKRLAQGPATGLAPAWRTAVSERVVDASPAEVWRLYTTREGAESWMVARASIELALGGKIKTSYDPGSKLDDDGTIVTHVLAYEPERLLATRFDVPKGAAQLKLAETTWVTLTLEPVDGGKTRVRCAHMGFGAGEDWDRVFTFFSQGNEHELGELAERCQALREKR
ncbi:MAG: SRPBCC domain-containing protein [Planctomycetes bacterium]|nr:SRPBCC domain-containing protein [Planctomycetota bacterium]